MYSCVFCCALMRYKLKLGMGVGAGPLRFVGIFLK